MKAQFLFPRKWRGAGLILLLFGIIALLLNNHFTEDLISWQNTHPLFYGQNVAVLINNIANGVCLLSLIMGLLLIGFSKEKIEDEQIAKLRLDSLQWAIYFNYIVLIFCIIFFNGLSLLVIITYNIFTPLVFFIIRFRWKIHQVNRLLKNEEELA